MLFSHVSVAFAAFALTTALPSPENSPDQQSQSVPQQGQNQQVMPHTYAGGEAIYYLQEKQYGTCMEVHDDTEHVVALSYKLQGNYLPPPHCGHEIEIVNVGGGDNNGDVGRRIRAKVVDTCTYCDTEDLELSVGAFQALKGGQLSPSSNFTVDWKFV